VARVALVLFSLSSRPLERFVFDVSQFPDVSAGEITTPFQRSETDQAPQSSTDIPSSATMRVNLEEQFRGTLARLGSSMSNLRQLPPECTYTIVIENMKDQQGPIGHPQPWIPVEPKTQPVLSVDGRESSDRDEKPSHPHNSPCRVAVGDTVPIRSVKAGEVIFELWVEEAANKDRSLQEKAGTPA
jgi:mitotic spindle assembly checkpoint protein MAD2B